MQMHVKAAFLEVDAKVMLILVVALITIGSINTHTYGLSSKLLLVVLVAIKMLVV